MVVIDIQKRIFHRILSNFIKIFSINDWMELASLNMNALSFFKTEFPDIFYKFKQEGMSAGLGSNQTIFKYITIESIREMLQNNAPEYLKALDNSNYMPWFIEQINFFTDYLAN